MNRIGIPEALQSLRPGAEWLVRGEEIEWLDAKQIQPSKEEIEAEIIRLTAELPNKLAKQNRANAFKEEADPLFFKAQRGEITMEEWNNKIEEIRSRYPYTEN